MIGLNLDRPVVMLLLRKCATIQQTVSITVGITQLILNSVGTAVQIRGRKSSERLPRYPYEYSPKSCPKYGVATQKVGKFIVNLKVKLFYTIDSAKNKTS